MTTETAPAVRQSDEAVRLAKLRQQLEDRAEEFRMVLPSHISADKLQSVILFAVHKNPDLLACDRRSFLTSCMKAAQDGLLPDGTEAAIIPFKTRVKGPDGWSDVRLAQYLPMVAGILKKVRQSPDIRKLEVDVVYRQEIERGLFVYEAGSEPTLRHKPIKGVDPDVVTTDADIAAVYSVATFVDGTKSFEVMGRGELDRVREASQTGAKFDHKGEPREPKGPWRDWFPEMAKKSVLRRHAKTLPQFGDIALVDVEAEEIARAAKSAVALLDSRRSDPPTPLVDKGEAFDPETGEALPEPTPTPEPEPSYPPGTPPKPKSRPVPEAKPTAPPEHKDDDQPEPEATPAEIDAAPKDDVGITKTDEELLADGFIARARACDLLVDFKTLENMAGLDLASMDPNLAALVDVEFAKARKRLTPPNPKAS